jgi:hypothetical protein
VPSQRERLTRNNNQIRMHKNHDIVMTTIRIRMPWLLGSWMRLGARIEKANRASVKRITTA